MLTPSFFTGTWSIYRSVSQTVCKSPKHGFGLSDTLQQPTKISQRSLPRVGRQSAVAIRTSARSTSSDSADQQPAYQAWDTLGHKLFCNRQRHHAGVWPALAVYLHHNTLASALAAHRHITVGFQSGIADKIDESMKPAHSLGAGTTLVILGFVASAAGERS